MELIDQHTKAIMEECKVRARDAGLMFDDESLEYIVTNRDLLELGPKGMIPTMYDYWVNDVETIKGKEIYKLYPTNPYETVINSRPAISFYNDNNPDWLNIMIFYHVLAHIDFFQHNILFEHTWDDDFVGQALADKRFIASLRSEHNRWVDYVIEFSRGIDNLVGYFDLLSDREAITERMPPSRLDYYFGIFLQSVAKITEHKIYKEIERYNQLTGENEEAAESAFLADVRKKHPEFQAKYEKYLEKKPEKTKDVLEFVRDHSPFLRKEENAWMKAVMNIVRNTSLYFQPQIRTKILNEGWASYWHDELFRIDNRIAGHEVAYAKTNAFVTSVDRVGLNPYAIGLRLIQHVQDLADKGRLSLEFQRLQKIEDRKTFDRKTGEGREIIFNLRRTFSDFALINTFVTQDFVDAYDLFVVGRRVNPERRTYEYYVKSRKAEDYKQMLLNQLPHPPHLKVIEEKSNDNLLYLSHQFEEKELLKPYIPDTLMGIEYLWGGQVQLETTEIIKVETPTEKDDVEYDYKRVLYTMKDRKMTKNDL
jgi:stage V sporulation protein R